MTHIWRAKFFIATFLTTLMVTLSYEVKSSLQVLPSWLLVAFSFVISTFLANVFVSLVIKSVLGRKIIMGNTWIEGYWYLSTTETTSHKNAISQPGIVCISYTGDNYILKVITYRSKRDEMHTGLSSVSDLATIRSFDLKFSNVFTISDNSQENKGVTTGNFIVDAPHNYPNRFEGHVVLFHEGINRRQTGTRIPAKVVKTLQSRHGEDWKDAYLKEKSVNLLS